jgi:arylsulfatase A-like enzyme
MENKTNVLFIIMDSLRSDALSVNGNPICRTPNIDALAKDGTSFSKCFSQNPVCAPSRASILTGWYPHVRGHRTFSYHIQNDEENLFKYFKKSGYLVKAAGTNDCLHESAFPDSIDEWLECHNSPIDGCVGALSDNPLKRRAFLSGELPKEKTFDRNWSIKEKTVEFIKSSKDKPWFFYSAFHIPHPKYGVPEPWVSMYDPREMPEPSTCDYEDKAPYMKEWHKLSNMDKLDLQTKKQIRAIYYGMVSLADHYVGEIVKALRDSGEYENTTIVFLADHGDYTGDFGLVEKSEAAIQDCIVNVPLIIKAPAKINIWNSGKVSDPLCEAIDVLPTLLDINNIAIAHNQYGKSLLPLLKGETAKHKKAVFFEGGYNPEDGFAMNGVRNREYLINNPDYIYSKRELIYADNPELLDRFACTRTHKWKYVQRGSGPDELYDMESDSRELENLINSEEHSEIVFNMKDILLDWYLRTSDSVSHTIDDRLCTASWSPEKGLKTG